MIPGNNPGAKPFPDENGSAINAKLQTLSGNRRRLMIAGGIFLLASTAAGAMLAAKILAPLKQMKVPEGNTDAHKAQIVIREQYNALQIIPQVSTHRQPANAAQPPAARLAAAPRNTLPVPASAGGAASQHPAAASASPGIVVAAIPPAQKALPAANPAPAASTAIAVARPVYPVASTAVPAGQAVAPARVVSVPPVAQLPAARSPVAQAAAPSHVQPVVRPFQAVSASHPAPGQANHPAQKKLIVPTTRIAKVPARQPISVVRAMPVPNHHAHQAVALSQHTMTPRPSVAVAPVHLAQAKPRPQHPPVRLARAVTTPSRSDTVKIHPGASSPAVRIAATPAATPRKQPVSPVPAVVAQVKPAAGHMPVLATAQPASSKHAPAKTGTAAPVHLASTATRPPEPSGATRPAHHRPLHIRPVPLMAQGDDDAYMPRHRPVPARMAQDTEDDMGDDEAPPRYYAPPPRYYTPPGYPGYMYRPPPPVYYPGW